MKRIFFALTPIFVLLTLCSCDGRTTQKNISAQDPFTGRILTLDISANYSPGDFDASGGCAFSSKLDFSEMIKIAESEDHVTNVEVFESFEQYYPYQHMGIFVEEEDGFFSVYYLDNGCFYGMETKIIETRDDSVGFEMLFPYHLVSDSRLSPVGGTLLEGVEYSCVDTEDICSEVRRFYQMTGHYVVSSTDNKVILLIDSGRIELAFVEHAGVMFVSANSI